MIAALDPAATAGAEKTIAADIALWLRTLLGCAAQPPPMLIRADSSTPPSRHFFRQPATAWWLVILLSRLVWLRSICLCVYSVCLSRLQCHVASLLTTPCPQHASWRCSASTRSMSKTGSARCIRGRPWFMSARRWLRWHHTCACGCVHLRLVAALPHGPLHLAASLCFLYCVILVSHVCLNSLHTFRARLAFPLV